jgi:hypothetical protein
MEAYWVGIPYATFECSLDQTTGDVAFTLRNCEESVREIKSEIIVRLVVRSVVYFVNP